MIDKEKYENIQSEVIQAQTLGQPCFLIVLDAENLKWISASNSIYESFGMLSRVKTCINTQIVHISKEEEEDGN